MFKKTAVFILLLLSMSVITVKSINARDYIIAGQNRIQRIHYDTSSSQSPTFRGDKFLDSNLKTAWISKKTSKAHWAVIDYGAKRIMSTIVVYTGRKNNYKTIKYFMLQFLYKKKWFDFARIDCKKDSKGGSNRFEIDLGGLDASTFRIYIPPEATYDGIAAITEIETFIGSAKINVFDKRLLGLAYPVKNGFLPKNNRSYPNSPRAYRGGRHVGLDIFYHYTGNSYEPILVSKETPVIAVASGKIIRADWNYKKTTPAEWKARSRYFQQNPRTFVMRSFGGIQVWIDHRNGILSAYNHLSRIHPSVKKGKTVKKGEIIGWVGNSGLMGEALGTNQGLHLHFELWIDGYYLGYGMSLKDVKKYVKWIFFPLQ